MTRPKPILCLGILVADVIGHPVRDIPAPGQLTLVEELGLFRGGCAATTAAVLARFAIPVQVLGRVGADPFGAFLRSALAGDGVDVSGVRRDEQANTSATMVLVNPDGERRFIHFVGANASLTLADIDLDRLADFAILHVAGALVMPGLDGPPMTTLLRQARAAGVTTTVDTAWDDTGRWLAALGSCLPHIDFFLPSLVEAQHLTGENNPTRAAGALLKAGVGTVVLKMGAAGCLLMGPDRAPHAFPAHAVDVVDTTGAGDSFVAGFLAGIWLGWPPAQAARLANAAGALCVTRLGAAHGLDSLVQTVAFMDQAPLRQPETTPGHV